MYAAAGKPHQSRAMDALSSYLAGQNYQVNRTSDISRAIELCQVGLVPDCFLVTWGDPLSAISAVPRLCLEAGYINGDTGRYHDDRLRFISAGWNGLHGDSIDYIGKASPARWRALGIKPAKWRTEGKYVLVLGQHPNDALAPTERAQQQMVRQVRQNQGETRYRPHPLVDAHQPSLAEHLSEARRVISWASTAAVEAVLAGVPTVTLWSSAIARPVTAHSVEADDYTGYRSEWAYNLACRQFTLTELADGTAWEKLQLGLRMAFDDVQTRQNHHARTAR